jgi:hypothetical protein
VLTARLGLFPLFHAVRFAAFGRKIVAALAAINANLLKIKEFS